MNSPLRVEEGQYYDVPSGVTSSGYVVPILFPAHEDGPEICSKPVAKHYHIDHRFSSPSGHWFIGFDGWLASDLSQIELRRMLCKGRTTYLSAPYVFIIEKLHRLFYHHQITNNRCPHQGTQLVNGCGTCPNHHLIWDMETGRLKHKLPFSLRIENSPDGGEIINSCCEFVLTQDVAAQNGSQVGLDLIDANGLVYPNTKFYLTRKEHLAGDTIMINDHECG